ncbi:hypothetical protein [Priestia megaterium]|uniref:hypothetical protein n=1 Tax=Priestia megaterium TaxID=1404 RepID=UPI0023D9A53C|nr:hypothetical protein [Priestia megaterium]MDF2052697.1 hypothetical protein [Priestia megaterium]MDF2058819.1 hypothetical protein [Priestia megaterium]
MKYFEEAKDLWINHVPKNGQANTVQGELIRAVEKLRYEAHNNGNGNWDIGFEKFCEYIWEILNDSTIFREQDIKEIRNDLDVILNHEQPYLEDDLYDRIIDRIIEWHLAQDGLIKREKDLTQYR